MFSNTISVPKDRYRSQTFAQGVVGDDEGASVQSIAVSPHVGVVPVSVVD